MGDIISGVYPGFFGRGHGPRVPTLRGKYFAQEFSGS